MKPCLTPWIEVSEMNMACIRLALRSQYRSDGVVLASTGRIAQPADEVPGHLRAKVIVITEA